MVAVETLKEDNPVGVADGTCDGVRVGGVLGHVHDPAVQRRFQLLQLGGRRRHSEEALQPTHAQGDTEGGKSITSRRSGAATPLADDYRGAGWMVLNVGNNGRS